MPLRIVQSKQNSRLKELRRLLLHPSQQAPLLAAIEGAKLLEEALRADLRLHTVFVEQGAEELLEGLALPTPTEVLLVPGELLRSVLSTETPQPVAALIEQPSWSWEDVFPHSAKAAPLLLILAGVQDPGNLGTMLRSAEAFGAQAILSLPGTVHAWNPKVVRASAGSLFRLPLLTVSAEEAFTRLREAGVMIWTTAIQGAEQADRINLTGPVAFIIGNEGNGVAESLAALADGAATIPCPGPVESLNASVAASVLLYEAARQRAANASLPLQKARRMGHPDSRTRSAP
jgi:TrmH family RNA methyltransferase